MSAQREMTLQEWVDRLPSIHAAHKEFDSLQATIEQQSAEIERLRREVVDRNQRALDGDKAVTVRENLINEIERLKTVPMKYRRMAFNAQLQEENAKLAERIAELEQAIMKYQASATPSERLVLQLRSKVAEQAEALRQSALNVGNWHRQFMAASEKHEERAALIEKCEEALRDYSDQEKRDQWCGPATELLAAIAAQKGGK